MEERKGTYNEDGEYVMTDEEAEEELKILKSTPPLASVVAYNSANVSLGRTSLY